ncbi:7TM diverse intracellular signaling domain-containing protein [Roseivirga seohaensis]|uniref:7TM diverse intracellular signaling domain-containing protein n=1 Tax=Roseivirga seohaensis TaxID=1914963 RepID=UPI003BA9A6DB
MKFRLIIGLLVLYTGFLTSYNLSAQNTSSNLEYSIHYFVDSAGKLSIDELQLAEVQRAFDATPLKSPNFGFDHRPYWFRVELTHPPSEPLVLEINQPSLDYISVFTKTSVDTVWKEQKAGHTYSPRTNDYGGIVYAFPIDPDIENNTIYVRVETIVSMAVPILIKPKSEYNAHQMTRMLLLGVFFGLMFIMASYNFLLYLFLKDTSYLFYVGATIMGLCASLVLNGFGYYFIWPNNPALDQHIYLTFGSLSMVFSSRFAANFLNLKKFDPKMNAFLWVICFASLLLAILSLFYTATELLLFGRLLVIITFPSYIIIGLRTYFKGYITAIYYVIAWIPYMLGIILMTFRGAGLIGEHWVTAYGIEFGGAIEVVLLSFALAARIKGMRKEIAEKELEKEQFKTRLLSEQREVLEQKVEERTQELKEANATKDKFFSIIAHDLRSPMIALQGVGQKLEYFIRKEKLEKLLEMGAKIDQSIDQLNHLLNNLLNWATSQTGGVPHHPTRLDLHALINENIELYRSLAESKSISIVCEISAKYVFADINTTSTIIRNLLSNALKFTKDGGGIKISTQQKNDFVELEIEDQGIGMDKQTLAQLFNSSVKAHIGQRGEKGFGLGLKLCNEFVKMNGGQIDVKSKQNIGTTFTVTLPTA